MLVSEKMIIEAFLVNHELDMLKAKLEAHSLHVGKFVLLESDIDFNHNPKPLHIKDNWHMFQPWHHKMELNYADVSENEPGWPTENALRSALGKCITHTAKDKILLTDLDEFCTKNTWQIINDNDAGILMQELFVGSIYKRRKQKGLGPRFIIGRDFVDANTHRKDLNFERFEDGGVHLSWMGDGVWFESKLKAMAEHKNYFKGATMKQAIRAKERGSMFPWRKEFNNIVTLSPKQLEIYFQDLLPIVLKHGFK